jgi:ribose transport system permease protein
MAQNSGAERTYLLVPIVLIAVLLSTAVIRSPSLVTLPGLGSAIIVSAPLILATYALMATTIAGRGTIDLAVGPLLAFINVTIVQLNGMGIITDPIPVFIVALGIGVLYQILFALIIIFVRVQPIIVALSGYLALTGINLVILPRPGGSSPEWMYTWGAGETIFSPVLLIVALATGGWLLFTASTFYSNLRMMGYDERAAFASGVRIYLLRLGAHIISGLFVGLAAICYTALIGSGNPDAGGQITLTAVTALVLGGIALSGGRGSVTGALMGAVTLYLIGYVLSTFQFGAIQSFVTDLAYGVILVLSLLMTLLVPIVARHISFISPYAAFVVLGAVVAGIILQVATWDSYVVASSAADTAAASGGDLMQRYFVLPEVASGGAAGTGPVALSLTPLQQIAFSAAAVLLLVVLVARMIVVEAVSLRLSLFLYVFIGALIVLTFVTLAQSGPGSAATAAGVLQ